MLPLLILKMDMHAVYVPQLYVKTIFVVSHSAHRIVETEH